MMEFQVTGGTLVQAAIIEELEHTLPFTLNDTGAQVVIQQTGHAIHLTKKDNIRTITYGNDNEFARAWYLMIRNEEKEFYDFTQNCAFTNFGVMLDCSRNAVMKTETLYEYIRQLAMLGYHTLELYTEDTLKIDSEPYVGYMRGAYSKEEIRQIDAYCRIFSIELVPCIQTLAHINQITRYQRYNPMIDVNDILLVGEEKTYEYLDHVLATVADSFTSKNINIGMDEAHMLGLGKYLDQHGYEVRFEIMIKHLSRVQELLNKYGFKAHMWSDMFFRLIANGAYTISEEQFDSKLFSLVPKNIELVYWDYYSRDYEHYMNNLQIHKKITNQVGFAAGAWKWTGFAPDNGFSQEAGHKAMQACIDEKVPHFLVTLWGDNGAEASAFSVLPTLYQYSEEAYGQTDLRNNESEEKSDQTKTKAVSSLDGFQTLTGLTFDEYMKLDLPNLVFPIKDYSHGNACKYFLYNDVFLGTFDSLAVKGISEVYAEHTKTLKSIADKQTHYSYLFKTLSSLCHVLELKADLGVQIKKAYDAKDKELLKHLASEAIPEVLTRLEQFQKDFRYQWHKENKSFGFEIQLIRLGGLKERLIYAKEQILLWTGGGIERIDELEEDRLPFAYFDEKDPSKVNYNLWGVIVSPAVIG